ncbi:MAG: hypothetical protein NTX86_02195 [Candidatus Dependentiae bacterium]|nr:hypothetical protein [Candidatus Dependentiae bacterium]
MTIKKMILITHVILYTIAAHAMKNNCLSAKAEPYYLYNSSPTAMAQENNQQLSSSSASSSSSNITQNTPSSQIRRSSFPSHALPSLPSQTALYDKINKLENETVILRMLNAQITQALLSQQKKINTLESRYAQTTIPKLISQEQTLTTLVAGQRNYERKMHDLIVHNLTLTQEVYELHGLFKHLSQELDQQKNSQGCMSGPVVYASAEPEEQCLD